MINQVDYSLYLVTDSTEPILGSRDLSEVVEQALQGGRLHFPIFTPNIINTMSFSKFIKFIH